MSTRQTGNRRENRFGEEMAARGYVPFHSRGSRGIDTFFVHQEDRSAPHIAAEVGGPSKAIGDSFDKLRAARKPGGTVCIVARELKRRGRCFFRVHVHEDAFYDDLDVALEVIKHL